MANSDVSKELEMRLLEIIMAVEDGLYTPEEAVNEFQNLKKDVGNIKKGMEKMNVPLLPDYALPEYTLADFQKIRESAFSDYESDAFLEPFEDEEEEY